MLALKFALNARVTAAPKTSNQMCFQIPFKMILTPHLRTVVIFYYIMNIQHVLTLIQAKMYGCQQIEASAKTGKNVDEVFTTVIDAIWAKNGGPPKKEKEKDGKCVIV